MGTVLILIVLGAVFFGLILIDSMLMRILKEIKKLNEKK